MPEAAIAEPPAETVVNEPAAPEGEAAESHPEISEPGFGNLSDAFDKAFPSTATKKEEEPAPAAQDEPPAKPKKADEPAPIEKKTDDKFADAVPEAVFGDKKAEEPPTEPKIEVPAHIKDPKQIKNFEQMRDLYQTTKKENTRQANEFARQLAEAKKESVAPELQKELEGLRRQNQQLLATVERKSLEDHPEFRRQITMPREQAMNEARQLVTDAQLDPKLLDRAMSKTGPERIEALEEIYEKLPEAAKAEMAAAVREVKRLDTRREELLKNAHGNVEKLAHEDKLLRHQTLQQHEQQMTKMATAAATFLAEEQGFEAFKKVDESEPGAKKWNEGVEERLADAQRLLLKETDPSQHALAAHLATATPFYRQQMLIYRDRWKATAKELAEIKGAEPRLDGGAASEAVEDPNDKRTFAEIVAASSGLR